MYGAQRFSWLVCSFQLVAELVGCDDAEVPLDVVVWWGEMWKVVWVLAHVCTERLSER